MLWKINAYIVIKRLIRLNWELLLAWQDIIPHVAKKSSALLLRPYWILLKTNYYN